MKGYKPKITLGTSVIVKWFRKEDDREYALLIRDWITEDASEIHSYPLKTLSPLQGFVLQLNGSKFLPYL